METAEFLKPLSSFKSILFPDGKITEMNEQEPGFFNDLNLNVIINSITAGKEEYNLKPFFYTTLFNSETIYYRQQIMSDLLNPVLFSHLLTFSENMHQTREQLMLINRLYYKYHKQRLFVDAVNMYCKAVATLENNLASDQLHSQGLRLFYNSLNIYIRSESFTSLLEEIKKINHNLSNIQYGIHIKGLQVKVQHYNAEPDYNIEIEETFAKFRQTKVKNYTTGYSDAFDMNHVEAQILDGVAQIFPEIFGQLDNFYENNQNFLNPLIADFDREIQFYISFLQFIDPLVKTGLNFCFPEISVNSKEIFCNKTFDLALADKFFKQKSTIVDNDFFLKNNERVVVISGPNQSGKTTFARTFGQIHYLAAIGCMIPGSEAKLYLFDKLLCHFEKQENIVDLRGKLEDDLFRIHDILNRATPRSIIILNEIFTSTTLKDAVFLSKKIMQKIINLDVLCIWVSFIDELSTFNNQTVSMTGEVDAGNPDTRTYKITRKPADGLAYAKSVAEKYQLTYQYLKQRIKI